MSHFSFQIFVTKASHLSLLSKTEPLVHMYTQKAFRHSATTIELLFEFPSRDAGLINHTSNC